ncbi:hypothetical protein LTR08_000306 [Meristemomyces frigidus]|nr:hypothetical protein LTR08_000306 [Meristemomyces frigidus]
MAEILGVVSAGAGLVSLSMQLLDSAQKLKRFYDDATNAPKTLDKLSIDLRTLALLLRELERYRVNNDDGSDALLLQCLSRLREEVYEIRALVVKLDQRLRGSRVRVKLSTAFKEPEIQRCLMSLESAKSSVLLAHQLYTQLRQQRDAERLQQLVNDQSMRMITAFDTSIQAALARQNQINK